MASGTADPSENRVLPGKRFAFGCAARDLKRRRILAVWADFGWVLGTKSEPADESPTSPSAGRSICRDRKCGYAHGTIVDRRGRCVRVDEQREFANSVAMPPAASLFTHEMLEFGEQQGGVSASRVVPLRFGRRFLGCWCWPDAVER